MPKAPRYYKRLDLNKPIYGEEAGKVLRESILKLQKAAL